MNRSTFRYGPAFGWAWLVGPLPLAIAWSILMVGQATLGDQPEQVPLTLSFSLYVWIVGTVVWAAGLLVFIPIWWLIRCVGRGKPTDAIVLGALAVGGTWLAALAGDGVETTDAFWTLLGVLSGGLAGFAGWRAGSRPDPNA